MFNPITRIRDIIELLRRPPGRAIEACVVTIDTFKELGQDVEDMPGDVTKYLGDYLVRFENDYFTVVPKKEFPNYYRFIGSQDETGKTLMPIVQIKPL